MHTLLAIKQFVGGDNGAAAVIETKGELIIEALLTTIDAHCRATAFFLRVDGVVFGNFLQKAADKFGYTVNRSEL